MSCFIFISLFIKINFIVSQNTFVHLIGYSIVADVSETIVSSDVLECAQDCLDSVTPCVGVQFDRVNCKLLTSIRNIIENATACDSYVHDRRNESAGDLGLTETDQLVYFNAFLSGACPQDAVKMLYGCSLMISVRPFLYKFVKFFKTLNTVFIKKL